MTSFTTSGRSSMVAVIGMEAGEFLGEGNLAVLGMLLQASGGVDGAGMPPGVSMLLVLLLLSLVLFCARSVCGGGVDGGVGCRGRL